MEATVSQVPLLQYTVREKCPEEAVFLDIENETTLHREIHLNQLSIGYGTPCQLSIARLPYTLSGSLSSILSS